MVAAEGVIWISLIRFLSEALARGTQRSVVVSLDSRVNG
jgi:hypothetical protein